jgi:two-component system, OmpR family, sensor histidine kinase BaeS
MVIKLKYKIFLSISILLFAAIGSMVLLLEESFDRTFLAYVNNYEREAQGNLITNLGELYHLNGSWEFIRDNQDIWNDVVASNFARAKSTRSRNYENSPPEDLKTDPLLENGESGLSGREKRFYRRNVALLDSTRAHVVGLEDYELEGTEFKPITDYDGRDIVGFLAARPLVRILETPDIEFSNQQIRGFNMIAIGIALLAFILSFPLARYLVSRINTIAGGTRELALGNYGIRIPETSSDELGKLSSDFNQLAMALEENEKARCQWIADISHELRTPLSILRGEIEAIQDHVRQLTPETMDHIHGEVINLDRLVKDLYELSMSDIGALSYQKNRINIISVLAQSISIFSEAFEEKRIRLKTRFGVDENCNILGDRDRLGQLFSNLLTNSLRYTEENGKLEIKVSSNTHNVEIEFNDSAPSVSDEDMSKLFDRLYRVESSRSRVTGGTGLGLAISKNIVEAHQGTIIASKSPHGGLQIKIILPLEN